MTETASESPATGGSVPSHYALRHTDDDPSILLPDEPRRTKTATSSTQAGVPPKVAQERGFVTSTETAEQMWFADVDGAAEARQFVADTDFDSETIYVEFQQVRECFTLELCSVTWSESDIHTQYGSHYRSSDVSCQTDTKGGASWLIRIPEVLDPDGIHSYGSGWSSGGCHRPREHPEDGEATTEAPHYGPKPPANRTQTATTEQNQ
ncbi:hypothetical protein C439_00365 [Haloferax mediterranei ATCC 33500]|uniref:Uncharacterized protein n=1 Tax=Haloferax mediterranei (strain ATCC 33500 / DSM 1411 / JCM 8866 / NBRC 14739 / NCIMB 2177 / R-4) TaxID=523841 RepID=M0J8A1_HALMT|nr:hypothetical protein C439_00365 [Haloferax mediterranei ATCC 33500]